MKKILIIAGETSGDTHGAGLVRGLRKARPEISISGIGGNRMASEGMELLYHVREMSFMGFAEVVKHLPFIWRVMKRLENWVDEHDPKAVVLIDYPGFNLRFARRMKKRDVPVYYYISPQVWAWGKGRLKKMKKLVDRMYVIFPFEEDLYREHDVPVEFVGHPLVEEVKELQDRDAFFRRYGCLTETTTIGLLPGSRGQEIERHLDPMLEALSNIRREYQKPLQFLLAVAPDLDDSVFAKYDIPDDVHLVRDHTYEVMQYSDVVVTSSGSATLEVAYFGTPMVIIYRTSTLTWWMGNLLVDMPYIGLANIVAGEQVVPELLQNDVNADNISGEVVRYLNDSEYLEKVQTSLGNIRDKLGDPGAGRRVAESIIGEIEPDEGA
ncbi:MAG: lipid-A-disaccharide synthase [Candidatus Marinimicrobia bacterium]|nr:lipid-A-disaccharide synthase [Candidatus Neomarinimicrobiota bacterium]MCF7827988.1 lipid-A-disaccharide synthase [Candidatus Neomarinimicrobiota bacterium]MCF7879257.1 lipid-A-disaccharide synthase [Candidatus Neomarinimicrobiota bacterium]